MKKLILLTIVTIMTSISVANADIAPEKRQEIEKMIQLTGMETLMQQMKMRMISDFKAQFKAQMTDVPESFWTKIQEKIDTHEVLEKIIPLYDKYYTLEDLKAVNTFYESPAGKKVLSALPQIMQEARKIGQDWGKKWAQK